MDCNPAVHVQACVWWHAFQHIVVLCLQMGSLCAGATAQRVECVDVQQLGDRLCEHCVRLQVPAPVMARLLHRAKPYALLRLLLEQLETSKVCPDCREWKCVYGLIAVAGACDQWQQAPAA